MKINFRIYFIFSAYHGHSMSVIDISPYKFKNTHGSGQADYIHVVESPDVYKGMYVFTIESRLVGQITGPDTGVGRIQR